MWLCVGVFMYEAKNVVLCTPCVREVRSDLKAIALPRPSHGVHSAAGPCLWLQM